MAKNETKLHLEDYLDHNLYQYYQEWKTDQGFESDVIALNYLIADFFDVEYPVNRVELHQRLEIFEQKLTNLTQQVESLTRILNQTGEISLNNYQEELTNLTTPKKTPKKDSSKTLPVDKTETINSSAKKVERKRRKKSGSPQSYEEMTKKDLFILLTQRNIPHRIAPKDRLKRKEEMIADLVASDQQ